MQYTGKATLDNGYGMFLNMLEYKLADRGKYFVKVDKWYPSSQICSCCGNQKNLHLLIGFINVIYGRVIYDRETFPDFFTIKE